MEGFVKEKIGEARDSFEDSIHGAIGKEVSKIRESEGLAAATSEFFEKSRVVPQYLKEEYDPEGLVQDRARLNSERGLIIANHPGGFDGPLILKTLLRDDVKVVMNSDNYAVFAPIFGAQYAIEARNDPQGALALIRDVKEHISEGGVVIIFPDGGKGPDYKDGFGIILKRCLAPTDMVYSFNIDEGDAKKIMNERVKRVVGAASGFILGDAFNVNNLKDEAVIKVDEKYSQASEWQALVSKTPKEERNEVLKKHFEEQFKGEVKK